MRAVDVLALVSIPAGFAEDSGRYRLVGLGALLVAVGCTTVLLELYELYELYDQA